MAFRKKTLRSGNDFCANSNRWEEIQETVIDVRRRNGEEDENKFVACEI